jgi:LacI family transcriptional regulator
MGFDDIPTAAGKFPTLSTMRQPLKDMAARAVDEVVQMIQGEPAASKKIAFPMELVVRNSTGPAPSVVLAA